MRSINPHIWKVKFWKKSYFYNKHINSILENMPSVLSFLQHTSGPKIMNLTRMRHNYRNSSQVLIKITPDKTWNTMIVFDSPPIIKGSLKNDGPNRVSYKT